MAAVRRRRTKTREQVTVEAGEDFGPWLARQLKLADMTQTELAQAVDVTRAAVSAWITGRAAPRPETIERIARALNTDLATVHTRTTDTQAGLPIGWYHRPGHADGGRELGNAAAFAFDADVEVLARETCQNSLDERITANGQPVRVRYTLHELTGERLARFREAIQWDDLFPHYETAAAQEQKVGRVIDAGLRDMYEHDRLVLLRVDDYNAAGLTGDDYGDGRFAAVVRRQLDSHKSGSSAGGSYGLGKATLWATSRLGLVLMNSTLSEPHEGRTERRLIGRLDLPWRQVHGKPWAGPAWLGRPDPDSPGAAVARSWWADEETVESLYLERESGEPGTSFLIVGAHDVASLADDSHALDGDEGEDDDSIQRMHHRLVRALGKNFWAAMTGGGDQLPLLEASVRTLRNGEVVLPEERVDPTITQPSRTRALKAFLDGTTVEKLTESGQVAMTTVPLNLPVRGGGRASQGEHRAVLLVTDAEDADGKPNRVAGMRGNRMTVRDAAVPGLPLSVNPFQAVLLVGEAAGPQAPFATEAEEFLRAAEPPEHNKWGQTEELTLTYSPSAYRRIASLTRDTNAAIKELVVRPKKKPKTGGGRLATKLTVGTGTKKRRLTAATLPVLEELDAQVLDGGAWQVIGEVRIPAGGHAWRLVPVAKFDVRSGPRPTIAWAELVGVDNCQVVDGTLRFTDGARSATFRGVTDPTTHAVRTSLSGLVVELRTGEGESRA
ncbi:helix-turn-helix transcriptional regulator [Streptomyces sp. Tu 3180]|nr:helix-turn-helix transcriptional regulator [Streptomyces sp. Tu 3180]KAF3465619.1 helix-turn-helix transcriptional regulator [Streptomyces sp. Tu 3180]